MYYLDISTGKC